MEEFKVVMHAAYSCFEGTSFIFTYLAKATGRQGGNRNSFCA